MNLIDSLCIENAHMTSENTCSARMALSSFHAQPQGYLNGGATLAFAEIVAGQMTNTLIGKEYFGVGQSVMASHLRPLKAEGYLEARGTLLVKGKTSHVWRFDMVSEAEKLISQITVTLSIVPFNR